MRKRACGQRRGIGGLALGGFIEVGDLVAQIESDLLQRFLMRGYRPPFRQQLFLDGKQAVVAAADRNQRLGRGAQFTGAGGVGRAACADRGQTLQQTVSGGSKLCAQSGQHVRIARVGDLPQQSSHAVEINARIVRGAQRCKILLQARSLRLICARRGHTGQEVVGCLQQEAQGGLIRGDRLGHRPILLAAEQEHIAGRVIELAHLGADFGH